MVGGSRATICGMDRSQESGLHPVGQKTELLSGTMAIVYQINFTLSYGPGSKNTKLDALSCLHSPNDSPSLPETVIAPSRVVAAISWEINHMIREALESEPDPGGGGPNRVFVPQTVCSRVLQWVHSPRWSGHPGVSRTLPCVRLLESAPWKINLRPNRPQEDLQS